MDVNKGISDKTHRILEAELDDYDPAEVDENVEEWLERVPPGDEPAEREAETDGGPDS